MAIVTGNPSRLLAGLGGCLLLTVATPANFVPGLPPALGYIDLTGYHFGWLLLGLIVAATLTGLALLRWWPYLLSAAALLDVFLLVDPNSLLGELAYPLALIGVLACAQSLIKGRAFGLGAMVAGAAIGGRLFGSAVLATFDAASRAQAQTLCTVLLLAGAAAVAPAWWALRRGDNAAAGGGVRPVVAGTLAMVVVIPLSLLTTERVADLLDIGQFTLIRHGTAYLAILGSVTLVIVIVLALVAGRWAFGGSLAAAVVHLAVLTPFLLAGDALAGNAPVRWLSALTGGAIGVVAVRWRWRVPVAATLAVGASVTLFIAYAATSGAPEKIATQRQLIPAVLLMIAVTAAATAVVGATAPALAPSGVLPAALGPLAAILVTGGYQTVQVTYQSDKPQHPSFLTQSAVLLLVGAAGIGGLGLAQYFAARRAERKRAEQIRAEAAAAERDRLARPIHDGVLQVLALVQRHGAELGGSGAQLAELAGAQETALRNLLSGRSTAQPDAPEDLRATLLAFASPAVEVATPAEQVMLPSAAAGELTAAVAAALDNVRRHAGPRARAWILLEDEDSGVRVTVRDDGVGFPPTRLDEAAAAGRLGVAQSMRGRLTDLGGMATVSGRPGDGTEVEFWLPR